MPMKKPINFDLVADLYDLVHIDLDIPFFLNETKGYDGEILELMCGTGRISIPLLASGKKMTCVDYSVGMLD
jgi:ubiquinone/menaquinone biosynthesis C-methylase UbiE